MMTETTVALIGAGAMGGAIGARLVETGTPLAVYDRNPEKVAHLSDKGARAARSAADAAKGARAVILSLNAAAIVRAPLAASAAERAAVAPLSERRATFSGLRS